jgi:hypothetical protein
VRWTFIRRPSPAMAVALLALFVALGGSSYAALRIGTKQIRNNSVRSVDIKNRTIRGKDIHRRTVRGGNVARRTLSGGNLVRNRVTGTEIRESSLGTVPNASNSNALQGLGPGAFVPAGKFVTTGSAKKLSDGGSTTVFRSGPFTVTATCVDGGGAGRQVKIDAKSTESSSSLDGTQGTTKTIDTFPGAPATAYALGKTTVALAARSGRTLDFVLQYGVNGIGANCWAAGFGFS